MVIGIDNADINKETKGGISASIDYDQLRLIHGGGYGTSGYGVTHAPPVISSPNKDEMATWITECQSSTEYEKLLMTGVDYLKKEATDLNSLGNLLNRDVAAKAIDIGNLCIVLKGLVKKAGLKWTDWAKRNLTFMSFRNVEKYMLLAERIDCHQYTMLGVDRLETLCSATKGIKGADPVGSFMNKHGITLDPTQDFDLDDFKLVVDMALNKDRLEKYGILNTDLELLKILTKRHGKFDGALLRDLKNIQDSGGDPNAHLRKLALSKVKDSSEPKEERQPKDFNNMSGKLIQTIERILKDEDQIDKVDEKLFKDLFQQLRILARARFGKIDEKTV